MSNCELEGKDSGAKTNKQRITSGPGRKRENYWSIIKFQEKGKVDEFYRERLHENDTDEEAN